MRLILFFFTFLLIIASTPSFALQEYRPLSVDKRIRTYTFNPNEIYSFTGHYGYQSSIEFSPEEKIGVVSLGDSLSWQVEPIGNRLFLKPVEPDATTNMTVITDKRVYNFELYAEEAEGIRDEDLVFNAQFYYPDYESAAVRSFASNATKMPDIEKEPQKYHFNYTLTGPENIAPMRIFDDGEFTYFQFRDKNAEIPAIFVVDSRGSESLINYRVLGDYIVVEQVSSQFTLRYGDDVVCVYNESRPLKIVKPEKKKKWLGIF